MAGPRGTASTIISRTQICRPPPLVDIHVTCTIPHSSRSRSCRTEEQAAIPWHVPTMRTNPCAGPYRVIMQIVARLRHLVLVVQLVVTRSRGTFS